MLKRFEIHSDLRLVVTNYLDTAEGVPDEDEPVIGVYVSSIEYDKTIWWENGNLIWIADEEIPDLIKALQQFIGDQK